MSNTRDIPLASLSQCASNSSPAHPPALVADAVFEGGGMRALAHIGALAVAEERGYRWYRLAGTSAGAMIAALVAAGYSAAELHAIMGAVDYRRFADDAADDHLHLHQVSRLLFKLGLHAGIELEHFMRELLQARGLRRFGDLRLPPERAAAVGSSPAYRLTVIAADVSRRRLLCLPQDLHSERACYGLDPDQLDIARAVRMSASIPFFYVPVSLRRLDGGLSYIVDGGLVSGFPLFALVPPDGEAARPLLGFRLCQGDGEDDEDGSDKGADRPGEPILLPPGNLVAFSQALLETMLSAHDRFALEQRAHGMGAIRTISIPVGKIGATRFDLSRGEIEALYRQGRAAAERFFAGLPAEQASPGARA
ncbi:patatin-like phospholipase family protein [Thermogemmatispora onikobensis]|uniref:patatin-like phospholipase family protein n=1 Tax=Thermogemmatispora onikobensis TaxID=732234 RepID=UPI0008539DD9|nr:patatin-like phospholipase family protein [Thermogemmatispora onikobensis]